MRKAIILVVGLFVLIASVVVSGAAFAGDKITMREVLPEGIKIGMSYKAVNKVLEEIGCGEKPRLEVFNKVDVVGDIGEFEMLQTLYPDALSISAKTGLGLDRLSEVIAGKYSGDTVVVRVKVSQSNGKVQSFLRACGRIIEEQYLDGNVIIDARLGRKQVAGLQRLHPEGMEIIRDSV